MRGLSQKQLGILAGMDRFVASARMNQYERGVHAPDFKTVIALAKVLQVPTAYLFCIEDDLAELILAKNES
jgi:transcriptional regulator with XRE-family HTH domain